MAILKILKSFIKPKWQHKKPEIRKQGLQLLNMQKPQDALVVEKLAVADEDASVRRLAVKRLTDLDMLLQIVANDSDEHVCRTAETRYYNYFAGLEKKSPELSNRLARLQTLSDKLSSRKLIEFLCIQGVEMELRLAALGFLDKESVLGDIAINDPQQQVRIAAVERLVQQSTLERVLKKVRSKDKKVSKQVKEKLALIVSSQERPLRLLQRAKQCCIEIESLVSNSNDDDLAKLQSRLQLVESYWQACKQEWKSELTVAWDEDINKRYVKTYDKLLLTISQYEKQSEELRVLEIERNPLRAEKRALCDHLDDKLMYFKNIDNPTNEVIIKVKQQITFEVDSTRLNWDSLCGGGRGQLAKAEEELLNRRFNSVCSKLNQHITFLENQQRNLITFADLIDSVNQQAVRNEPVDLQRLKTLEDRLGKLRNSIIPLSVSLSGAGFDSLAHKIDKIRQRYLKEQQTRQHNIEKFTQYVVSLQQALEQGSSQRAIKIQRQAQKILKNMPKQDVQSVRKQGDERRFQMLVKQIDELRDWKRWASTPFKEQLVEEMEALVIELNNGQDEIDIMSLSSNIRQAREQWKKLGESEPDSAEELWERFNNACNQAYEPCQTHFDKQKFTREENLIKRQVICKELEQFLLQNGWLESSKNSVCKDNVSKGQNEGQLNSDNIVNNIINEEKSHKDNINWKKAERLLRMAQQEWNETGSIEKKAWTAINKQFHHAMTLLRQKTSQQRARNEGLKEQLIQQLNVVAASTEDMTAESSSLNDAIENVKKIQAKWKNIGAANHENKLWTQFRASCDVVFDLRQAHSQAKDQEKKVNLNAKKAICELIEAISARTGDALILSLPEIDNAKKDWLKTGPIDKEDLNKLNKRYKKALEQLARVNRSRIADERRQLLNILIHKAKLCEEVEYLVDDLRDKKQNVDDVMKNLQSIQSNWQELVTLDDKIEQSILVRFQNAIDELIELSRNDDRELPENREEQYQSRRSVNLKERQLICIRMEILAGVESPVEYQQVRMEYQVTKLADKMRQGDLENKAEIGTEFGNSDALILLYDWSFAGPITRAELGQLTQRFDSARSIFLQKN